MKHFRLEHDEGIDDPSTFDGAWTLYSFNRHHRSYANPEQFFPNGHPTLALRNRLRVGLAFTLAYTEHGSCRWLRAERYGGRDQWDTRRLAGVLVWEHPPGDMGARTFEDRRRDADQFLETYTSWCNGEGYCFDGYDLDTGEEASLCGFYGNDLEPMWDAMRDFMGDDPDYVIGGDADFLEDAFKRYLQRHPFPPRHGPPTIYQFATEVPDVDRATATVWADWGAEHGYDAPHPDELKRLRRRFLKEED